MLFFRRRKGGKGLRRKKFSEKGGLRRWLSM